MNIALKITSLLLSYPEKELLDELPELKAALASSAVPEAVAVALGRLIGDLTGRDLYEVQERYVHLFDRTRALSLGLNAIRDGLAEEDGDDLIVHSDPALAGQHLPAEIDTFADHRIAMSFALAGLKISGITILDPLCVGKTYPGYWDALASLGVEYET